MSWLMLFGLWPMLWLCWRLNKPATGPQWRLELGQLTVQLSLALYLINCCYAFDGSFTPLRDYQFVSRALGGVSAVDGVGGSRFSEHWIGTLPVPFPKDYLLGLDSQKRDLEEYRQKSYLRGEWKDGGWWYYYLYGFVVKEPHASQALLILAVLALVPSCTWNEMVLLAVPLSLLSYW